MADVRYARTFSRISSSGHNRTWNTISHRNFCRLLNSIAPANGHNKLSFTPLNYGFTRMKYTKLFQERKREWKRVPFLQKFHTSYRRPRDHHFDTLRFVQRLQEEGFTQEQSVAMMKVLSDVIEESIQNLTRTMVMREEQAKATYTQKVDFAKLRTELQSSDFTESATTRASHERLTNDIAKLNSKLRDEISRTQASVRLDLNLEKGRIREEANVQELKIKETETKIEQEVAGLREKLEGVKFQTLQWLMGVCTGMILFSNLNQRTKLVRQGTAALILGAWRLLM
ncbi:Protein FMP32, mitochondrial [Golovinomyces cichoracearum]|uniref:Protein FMP32, mitochondrial n=1 Tax=Golovinomyces cichoracearum TaxID=62708 RepID=A0A420HZT3_9PEZI|nr:Protein FMP32, mitochondrial [Golovinomyces cichoracearum]